MKRGTPRHPKTRDLCDALGCSIPLAVGYLELLWHFTAEYAPQGDIGRYSDRRIEGAMHWHKSTGTLIKALVTSGWVDPHPDLRLTIHDWQDHADDAVRKKLVRSGLAFATDTAKVTGQSQTLSATLPDNGGLPEPCPATAKPLPLPHANGAKAGGTQQQQQTEYPLTTAELRRHDPGADPFFVLKLAQASIQACISAGDMEVVDDEDIAAAVKESYAKYTGKRPHGTALLLNRVPQILVAWGKSNEQAH